MLKKTYNIFKNLFTTNEKDFLAFPARRSDNYLLKTWKKITPPKPDNDVSFQAGASDLFVPRSITSPHDKVKNFTIATWNVENMFLKVPEDIPGKKPTMLNYTKNSFHDITDFFNTTDSRTPIKPEKQLLAAAEALKSINADIVALQEVNNMEDLDTFQKKYMGKDAYPYSVLIEGNDGRGIDVGVLSKYPIMKAYTHRDYSFTIPQKKEKGFFSRDLLEAIIKITPQYEIKIFVTHAKSQRGGEASDRKREGEAQAANTIINKHLSLEPNIPTFLAADLNDKPGSPSIKILCGPDSPLRDPLEKEGKQNEPTHHNEKFGNTKLDYILVSPATMKQYQEKSSTIYHTKTVHDASDHDPIKATYVPTF